MWPNTEQTWLLKASLFSGLPAQEAWRNWTQRIDFDKVDSASYGLLPLVSRNRDLESLQDPIFEKCKGVYRQRWVMNHFHWKNVLPVLTQLLKEGVDKIVLLKGMAMIFHYYRDFGVRVIGDVDIFVGRDRIPAIDPFLRRSGWQPKGTRFNLQNQEHLNRWHALSFVQGSGMEIDVHWSFILEHCPSLDKAVLDDAKPLCINDIMLYMPNPTDLFLQTCIHGVKYSPIPLIRWIADAMTILKHSEKEMDWERLVGLAREARICIPLSLALQFLIDQFDAPIPRKAVEQLRAISPIRLERLEHRSNIRGHLIIAEWHRYCLNRGYLTTGSRLLHLPNYLRVTARLKSYWSMPFFAIYWIFKGCRNFRNCLLFPVFLIRTQAERFALFWFK